jgi:glutathione peroxidase
MNALRRRARAQASSLISAYDFSFSKLDGGEVDLQEFAGKVLLIVNVASQCGFTSQYRDLEALYQAKAKNGLVVIGVPSNDFGSQEPGAEAEIADFCEKNYHVTFPMTGKVEILGQGRHPFYQWIAQEAGAELLPRWNFHKYLIGRDGQLTDAFPSKAAPLGSELLTAIDRALAR